MKKHLVIPPPNVDATEFWSLMKTMHQELDSKERATKIVQWLVENGHAPKIEDWLRTTYGAPNKLMHREYERDTDQYQPWD